MQMLLKVSTDQTKENFMAIKYMIFTGRILTISVFWGDSNCFIFYGNCCILFFQQWDSC